MDNWDKRYYDLAKEFSKWSKDPSSKIGAVAIGAKGEVLSSGYNGFPRGIADTEERLHTREIKYKLVVHAEANCIYNATRNGVSLNGSTMYVYGLPCCSDCAKAIIQVGVKRVVMNGDLDNPRWKDSLELAMSMFKESGVEVELVDSYDKIPHQKYGDLMTIEEFIGNLLVGALTPDDGSGYMACNEYETNFPVPWSSEGFAKMKDRYPYLNMVKWYNK